MQRAPVVLLAFLALAGCLDGDRPPADPEPSAQPVPLCLTPSGPSRDPPAASPFALPVREGFEATAPGSVPQGWVATDGAWAVEAPAPGGSVLRGEGDADPGFSSLLVPQAGSLGDFTARVTFRMECIEHPHGVGLVLHVAGADDYQIVRYSASESSWDLFTVVGGERVKQTDAHAGPGTQPDYDDWVDLRVTSQGGRVQAYDGATLVLDYQLPAGHSQQGQVGLFLRGTSVALFDDVAIDGLHAPLPVAGPSATV